MEKQRAATRPTLNIYVDAVDQSCGWSHVDIRGHMHALRLVWILINLVQNKDISVKGGGLNG